LPSKKKKILHRSTSPSPFIWSSIIEECLKILTNLLLSLNFYGELGTAEVNGNSLLQGFSEFVLHRRNLPGNLNYGFDSTGGCDSLLGGSLVTGLKTLPAGLVLE
jgi:hypothetical protein